MYDVTTGSLLGLAIAHLSFRRYYPSLTSPRPETPYPNRAEVLAGRGKVKDEEAGVGVERVEEESEEEDGRVLLGRER